MGSNRVRIAVGAVVALAVVGAVVVVLATRGGTESVTLEPVTADGPDPFTTSVVSREVPSPAEQVTVAAARLVADQHRDDATGTRAVGGTEPGLYGGTGDASTCDVAALAAFLADDEAKAAAWAGVLGIDVDEIPTELARLTPVVLTTDTLVTNHGFAGGRATPRQAVLQAGTAVLVDEEGVPRVRCACGNPLAEPAAGDLAAASTTGERWDGYDVAAVATVRPAEPVDALTLVDLTSGERYEQPVGSAVGTTWLAVSGKYDTAGGPTGAVHTSPDGRSWTIAATGPDLLYGVATSDDLAVVVGASVGGGGVVRTSTDGANWSAPTPVIDPLRAVAHGDGRWVAVGDRSFAEESGAGDGSAGAIWTSTDGVKWERTATTSPYDNTELTARSGGILHQAMLSVAYGDGTWVATAQECTERVCLPVEFTSTDATTWTRRVMEGSLGAVSVAHDSRTWAFVGRELTGAGAGATDSATAIAGRSTDGETWNYSATEPEGVILEGLAAGSGAWLAVQDRSTEPDVPSSDGIYRSEDLITWSEVSIIEADLHGVAVFAVGRTTPAAPATTTTTAPAPATDVDGIRVLTRGLQFQDLSGMNTSLAPFAGPATAAVDVIRAMLGEPRTTVEPGDGTCVAESTVLSWGALSIVVPGRDPSGPDWKVVLRGTQADLPAVPVTVPGEFSLGAPAADVAGNFPGVPTQSMAYQGVQYDNFLLDPSGGRTEPGTLVSAEDGVVRSIVAPAYLEDMC